MEAIALLLALIILILVIIEIISIAKTKKPKLDLPPLEIDHDQNQLTMFKDDYEKTDYLASKEWKNKAKNFKEEFTK